MASALPLRHPPRKLRRVGIPNLGNTCYAAAVLQCLASCECFREYMTLSSSARRYRGHPIASLPSDGTPPSAVIAPEPSAARAIRGRESALRHHRLLHHDDEEGGDTWIRKTAAPLVTAALARLFEGLVVVVEDDDEDDRSQLQQQQPPRLRFVRDAQRALCEAFCATGAVRGWRMHRQNDAHEFCGALLERLAAETGRRCNTASDDKRRVAAGCFFASYPPTTTPFLPPPPPPWKKNRGAEDKERQLHRRGARSWEEEVSSGYGAVVEQFYGQYVSQVRCGACGAASERFELMNVLPLPLPPPHPPSLSSASASSTTLSLLDALDAFFADEPLEEWRCDACSARGAPGSRKTYRLWKPPPVLLIALKRFDFGGKKDRRAVHAPATLSVDRYSSGPLARLAHITGASTYRLRGTACHAGSSIAGGHYYAVLPPPPSSGKEEALVCDDEVVHSTTQRPPENVARDAYLLAYEANHPSAASSSFASTSPSSSQVGCLRKRGRGT